MIKLPWRYRLKRKVLRWFYHTLLRRPFPWGTWSGSYRDVESEEAQEEIRRAIDKTTFVKPKFPDGVELTCRPRIYMSKSAFCDWGNA